MFPGSRAPFARLIDRGFIPRTRCRRAAVSEPRLEPLEERALLSALTWSAGPSLPTARGGVVAISQNVGTIMVLGGTTTDVPGLSAVSPSWKATVTPQPALDIARVSPGVGITPDGNVLVFGGRFNDQTYFSTTLYNANGVPDGDNPTTQQVGVMNYSRYLMGFATDANHLVYAIGGIGLNSQGGDGGQGTPAPLASVEVYNQSTDTWTTVASLPQALYSESAVADGSGHIYTFGGVTAAGVVTSTVYQYTIATNTWSTAASMPFAVRDSAAVFANGSIYVLGGSTASGATSAVESYNPTTNAWTVQAPLPSAVSSEGAAVDSLGRIEVLGGFDTAGKAVAAVWVSQELSQSNAAPVITSSPTTTAYVGLPYSYQVFSTANPQATYSLVASPSGMTINSVTGLISWKPAATQTGAFSVIVSALNAAGSTTQTYTGNTYLPSPTNPTGLTVLGGSPTTITLGWNPSTDPTGPVTYEIYAVTRTGHSGRGGGITIHYNIIGTSKNPTYTVTGLTAGYHYDYIVRASDSAGRYSQYYSNEIFPTAQNDPMLYSSSGYSVNAVARHSTAFTLTAYGYPAPFTYSIVGAPTGMVVNPTTGVVSWTPPDSYANSTIPVLFNAVNSAGTAQLYVNVTVAPNLAVPQYASADLIGGALYATPTQAFAMQLSDGYSHSAITWSVLSGPAGVQVNASTGAVTWTPAAGVPLGVYDITFQAQNYAGVSTITVPLMVTFDSGPTGFKATSVNPTAGTAVMGWSAPAAGVAAVSEYRISLAFRTSTGVTNQVDFVPSSARSLSLTGLPKGVAITAAISALDSAGDLGSPSLLFFTL